jgi:methylmalonyl-CoA mutase C-terminal domain/subunit
LGGIILDEDIPKLKEMGVAGVFPSGVPLDEVAEGVRALGEQVP